MSDYFEELGYFANDFEALDLEKDKRAKLEKIAIINGIDMDIEVPNLLTQSIDQLENHQITEADANSLKCNICHVWAESGELYKIISSCKDKFHKDCILLWLKKALVEKDFKACPGCNRPNTIDLYSDQLKKFRKEGQERQRRADDNAISMFG
ncbi:E3 ubiquitin-protein ligase RNF181 homolog [Drosophila willistoni]|uniref:E3 ubiquitin-protein ligase RNF181 homolog n=1 Tax=Drosophila willistoni TaxID=7260 RepID=UPI000C26D4E4|nr:E3 ubiquitin-protein ligase RNF181 homolog [Drosophila willistoni]